MSDSSTNKSAAAAAEQHALIGVSDGAPGEPVAFASNPHPDARWFDGAGLGLFVHWGIASVHGAVDISWGMIQGTPWTANAATTKITPADYYALADRFDPKDYDPARWLRAARDAGCTYAVLTTKHHDGYTLWPSASGGIGVHTHLGGRDLVRPFVEACRELGLRVGLYYSPPDWHFERRHISFEHASFKALEMWRRHGGPRPSVQALGWHHEPVMPEPYPDGFAERFAAHVRTQIEELLTRYGRIDLLWFDGRPYPRPTRGEITIGRIRELQPALLVNPRLLGAGDYEAFECRMPESPPAGRWEHCDLLHGGGWGYHAGAPFYPAAHQAEKLKRIQAWGGNYLANSGLGPDGDMPPGFYQLMDDIRRLRGSGDDAGGAR